jgi:hypothetical protein
MAKLGYKSGCQNATVVKMPPEMFFALIGKANPVELLFLSSAINQGALVIDTGGAGAGEGDAIGHT